MSARAGVPTPARRPDAPFVERVLLAIGADPQFAEDVLGDLAEEHAMREAADGRVSAGAWYLLETMRAVPHLVWSAARRGTPRARLRLAAFTGATMLALGGAVALWMTRPGPPARITVGDADGVTINNYRPVRLTARVLDAAGRLVKGKVQYRWISGTPVPVSRDGIVECRETGIALVRASLGPIATDMLLRCAPVRRLMVGGGSYYVGDSAQPLVIHAEDWKGREVRRLAGLVRVEDSTVVKVLPDGRLLPLRAGETSVRVDIGDRSDGSGVTVYERVPSFVGLRPDQRWVVAPVHLTQGEFVRWPLPPGDFVISFGAGILRSPPKRGFPWKSHSPEAPLMMVEGPVVCMPELLPGVTSSHCLARGTTATITLTHPGGSLRDDVTGMLALGAW